MLAPLRHVLARGPFTALVLVVACVAPLRQAWAAPPDDADADALINRGIELREHGKDDEALGVFKKAYAKSPVPKARAQVALAEQALGLWVAAEADLLGALAATDDAWITKNRGALEGALATVRRRLGSLDLRGTDGADVTLDGVRLGTLPSAAPYRVEAGRRTLELHAKGYYPTTRTIEIPAGGVDRETVTLVANPVEPAGAGAVVGEGDAGAKRGGDNGEPHQAADPGHGQRLLGWIFVGTGAALIGTGVISFLVRKSDIDDYNVHCPGVGAATQSQACSDTADAAKTWLYVGISTLIAGGVFAIGGTTLVVMAPRKDASASPRVRVGCAPSMTGAAGGLFCSGTF